MTTSATLKYTHLSPQKMRLIADQIRGMSVDRAVTLLSFSNKKGAKIVKKVLKSAIANAFSGWSLITLTLPKSYFLGLKNMFSIREIAFSTLGGSPGLILL